MTAIIFGSSGQDGYYLAKLLEENNIRVIGVSRSSRETPGDVGDAEVVTGFIKKYQPEYIFHLAAQSSTGHSLLYENHRTITIGTLNILEAAKLHSPRSRIFLSGSALQFKNSGTPIDEQTPFEASSAYAAERIASVYFGRYFRNTFDLKVYAGYFFHHDSPLRSEKHINQKIIRGVQRIAQGDAGIISIGNIDVRKEYNYAGDVVAAVWALVNQNDVFEAVIGSGNAYSIKEWITICFDLIGKDWKQFVEVQSDYTPDFDILVSNPAVIRGMGWSPKIGIRDLANIMYNDSVHHNKKIL